VDASAIAEHLLRPRPESALARALLTDRVQLVAPYLCDAEVLSVLRAHVVRGLLSAEDASTRLELYARMPLRRMPHRPLLTRALAYRDNRSSCDALYVVLAEALDASLLTADERLARALRSFTLIRPFEG
jgi:predicted nucleic acid-binding protein